MGLGLSLPWGLMSEIDPEDELDPNSASESESDSDSRSEYVSDVESSESEPNSIIM